MNLSPKVQPAEDEAVNAFRLMWTSSLGADYLGAWDDLPDSHREYWRAEHARVREFFSAAIRASDAAQPLDAVLKEAVEAAIKVAPSAEAEKVCEGRIRGHIFAGLITGMGEALLVDLPRILEAAAPILRRDLAARLAEAEYMVEAFKGLQQSKSPCGHWASYAHTVDGGKRITCWQCRAEEAEREVQRAHETGIGAARMTRDAVDRAAILETSHAALIGAATTLRAAQRAYMADRGNNEKGQAVARAAELLDETLAASSAIIPQAAA